MATCCWCGAGLVKAEDAWWCGAVADTCRKWQAEYAVETVTRGKRQFLYVPTPKQTVWHRAVYDRELTRILVGGAAGPGKSRWLRETLYRLASQVPGFHALLLRKTHKDLDQSHLRFMPHELEQRGAEWKGTDRIAVFRHKGQADAVIRAGHLEDTNAIENYLSSEYDAIAPDELVTFQRDPMLELFSRARSTNPALFALRGRHDSDPELELDGSLVVTATNPGGRGALWVKDFFVDHSPDPDEFPNYEPQKWAFFEARLSDNPYVKAGYRKTLLDMREARRRQLLDGDWHVYEGQFFSEFKPQKNEQPWHVTEPHIIKGTRWSGGMDWGWNSPGWLGWFAHLADGHYHLAYELKFQGKNAEEVAAAAKAICKQLGISHSSFVISGDPAMWSKTGHARGESIAETLMRRGLSMRRGDNDRMNGAMRLHEFFREAPDGQPWLTVSPACKYFIRTIPALMQDKNNPEDVDTDGDDHAFDGSKYWAMSRPSPTHVHREHKIGSAGSLLQLAMAGNQAPVLGSSGVRA